MEEKRANEQMIAKYRAAKYKKYWFTKPEPYLYPELANDNSRRRIEEEMALYNHLKSDDRIEEIDGGLTYYMVNAAWITKWREFI